MFSVASVGREEHNTELSVLLGRSDLGMMLLWKEAQKRREDSEHDFSFLQEGFLSIKEQKQGLGSR